MKIKLNRKWTNKCPRCGGLVRYCNCDILDKRAYSDEEIKYINAQI